MAEYIKKDTIEKFIKDGLNNPDKSKAFGHDAIEILEEIYLSPAANVVEKEKYDRLLKIAKKMHTWIFLNTGDEQAAYDECGLTDEENVLLGYGGKIELHVREKENG